MKPTDRQIRYAMHLMARHGYRTDYFAAQHAELGLSMRERSGLVADMSLTVCDKIIRALKDK